MNQVIFEECNIALRPIFSEKKPKQIVHYTS